MKQALDASEKSRAKYLPFRTVLRQSFQPANKHHQRPGRQSTRRKHETCLGGSSKASQSKSVGLCDEMTGPGRRRHGSYRRRRHSEDTRIISFYCKPFAYVGACRSMLGARFCVCMCLGDVRGCGCRPDAALLGQMVPGEPSRGVVGCGKIYRN